MEISDSVVFVTGATGGLGQEFVRQMLDRGAGKVYAGARRDHSWGDSRVVPIRLHVDRRESIHEAAKAADDVTVLINNAGVLGAGSLLKSSLAEIRSTYETNVFGPLEMVRAFGPTMARADESMVVNIHSFLSWLAAPGSFSSSKTALWGLTNGLRMELAEYGVGVLGAHLAFADTKMFENFSVAKTSPAEVVRQVVEAIAAGDDEVFVDDTTRAARMALSSVTTGAFSMSDN